MLLIAALASSESAPPSRWAVGQRRRARYPPAFFLVEKRWFGTGPTENSTYLPGELRSVSPSDKNLPTWRAALFVWHGLCRLAERFVRLLLLLAGGAGPITAGRGAGDGVRDHRRHGSQVAAKRTATCFSLALFVFEIFQFGTPFVEQLFRCGRSNYLKTRDS